MNPTQPNPDHNKNTGTLYLVPAPLDFGCDETMGLDASMPRATTEIAAGISQWICENAKSTRAYLKRIGESTPLCLPIQAMQLQELFWAWAY